MSIYRLRVSNEVPKTINGENFLNVTEVNKRDNWLELQVAIQDNANCTSSSESKHTLNASVTICLKVLIAKITNIAAVQQYNQFSFGGTASGQTELCNKILLLFKFVKTNSNDEAIYSVNCNSIGLGLLDKAYCTDNDCWFLVHETIASKLHFNIIFTARIIKSENPFKSLYEDAELMDFRLVGEGGSEVKVHGAVLAAQSPTIMKMVQDKTIKDNTIEYSEFKEKTLQDFKSYIYLYVLPTEDIEQLLIFASKLKMAELERKCIGQIMATLSATNVYHITEFAQQHKIHELYLNVLENIQNNKIKVSDVRSCLKLSSD